MNTYKKQSESNETVNRTDDKAVPQASSAKDGIKPLSSKSASGTAPATALKEKFEINLL